jgi:signal transduction histidine kinase
VIVFLFVKAKKGTARTTLILAFVAAIIFMISHVLGVSVQDGELSRKILMFNMVDIFLPIFTGHCVYAFLNKEKELRNFIIGTYVAGIGLIIFFLIKPFYFLTTSIPKMSFPNYYVAGPGYALMLLFFFILVVYTFYIMFREYKTGDKINRNRIKYFALALFLAYAVGSIDFLLIYNIQMSPIWGFLFIPLFAVPFTYAAVQYELMDIKLVAKKAFVFIVLSGVIGVVLILLNYLDNLIIRRSLAIPDWVSPLVLGLVISIGLLIVWRKIREADLLKYEFVSIITHKFRTPLTAIRWFSENLKKTVPDEFKEDINNIHQSAGKLIDLTNLLTNLSVTDEKVFAYNFQKVELNKIIQDIVEKNKLKIKNKNINLNLSLDQETFISVDEQKINFVFQTLIENAFSYSSINGKVDIKTKIDNKNIIFEITDSGIGISEKEIKHIFTKFYRTTSSRKADTEGMGIGLYLTQRIVEKHNGKIGVKSEGLQKGSTFWLSLPVFKD